MSHFSHVAYTWDSEEKISLMKTLAGKVLSIFKPAKESDILDFGCGTGLFGLEFSDYAKTITGVDTSEGMLKVFEEKTKGNHEFSSILIDLEKENINRTFDLIISSMAFHHLDDPLKMIGTFKDMLRKNGHIIIVDLDKEDGSFHPNNKKMGVKHFGFSKDVLESWAKKYNLNIKHQLINTLEKNGKEYHQFMAVYSF